MKRLIFLIFLFPALLAFAQTKPIKVACIGNSITYGYGLSDPSTQSYPAVLQRLLGPDYEVGNFGLSGATLLNKGHRPYMATEEFRKARAYRPDVAVIHLGINDTDPRDWPLFGREFVGDYLSLLDSMWAVNPRMRIILARMTPLSADHPRYESGTRQWHGEVQQAIENVAAISGAELIDFFEPFAGRMELLHDAIHPNEEGAEILAKTVYGGITGDYGGLQLPLTFTTSMVLQRNKPVKIHGTANAGTTVKATLTRNGMKTSRKAVADNRGKFIVELPAQKEGTGMRLEVTDGTTRLNFSDVAVGEVWLASGQSNMEFALRNDAEAQEALAGASDSLLRVLHLRPRFVTNKDQWGPDELKETNKRRYFSTDGWQRANPDNAAAFSAVAYYFAKELRDSLQVPVGIISDAVGGSPAQSWISYDRLAAIEPAMLRNLRHSDYPESWTYGRIKANLPTDDPLQRHPYHPAYLYEAGTAQLGHFPVAGVIWYQGESNQDKVFLHEKLFPEVVEEFRDYFSSPSLPFYFCQLSGIDRPSWPEFRDSQRRMAQKMPGVEMAVTMDYGDSLDVHPRHKRPVGERLARQALNHLYSFGNLNPNGPLPKIAWSSGDTVTVSFDFAKGLTTSDGLPARTFELASIDGLYFPAAAEIDTANGRVRLYSPQVKAPTLVRYAFQPFTRANLINADSLPASTFKLNVGRLASVLKAEEGIEAGVSGAFAGVTNGWIIRAGGCNFPENPLASNANKKFYRGIYGFREADARPGEEPEFQLLGNLPTPVAYGAAASTPGGVILVGGNDGHQSLSSVYLLTMENDSLRLASLPSLPFAADNLGAALSGPDLCVAGGTSNGRPIISFAALNLTDLNRGWVPLPNIPMRGCLQPVMAADNENIYLFGGYTPKTEGHAPSVFTDGLRFSRKNRSWTGVKGPVDADGKKVTLTGAAGVMLPDGKLSVFGGVNAEVFRKAISTQQPDYLAHPTQWYEFNPTNYVFDTATGKWSAGGQSDDWARAGASLVASPSATLYLIGGETRPRVRTSSTSIIQ